MADDRKIVIELIATDGSSGDENDDKENDEEKETQKRRKRLKKVAFSLAETALKQVETQVFYEIGKYTSLSDDYKTAILVDNAKTTVNKVISLGKSVLSMARAGLEIGGGVGAGVGAVIGLGVSVGNEALSLARQYTDQSLNLYLADKESKYSRTRLGLIDNGRGTQN